MNARIALGVEYLGTDFFGWQRQPSRASVQGELERALSHVADMPIEVVCAGRTDSGVHATAQVVHFDIPVEKLSNRPNKAWVLGSNTQLPASVRVLWAQRVDENFSARFSATARRYQYFLWSQQASSAILQQHCTVVPTSLNAEAMHEGAQHLLGEQDFSAFRAADCQSKTPFRCIEQIRVSNQGAWTVVDVTANAFLHHMVRNIVGVLMQLGQGRKPTDWVAKVLESADRRQAAQTAPATGLYLVGVRYPEVFGLPETALRAVPFCKVV